jgi:hypothetical protein
MVEKDLKWMEQVKYIVNKGKRDLEFVRHDLAREP